jgi:hypothetical protein
MKYMFLILAFSMSIFVSCKNNKTEKQIEDIIISDSIVENNLDSIYTFEYADNSRFFFKINKDSLEDNKGLFTIEITNNDKAFSIFKDSFEVSNLIFEEKNIVEYRDINGDKVKDLLILTSTDGHNSNRYELFLINNDRKFIRIKDFSKLFNPVFIDSTNQIKAERTYRLSQTREEYFKWKGNYFQFIKGSYWTRNSINDELKLTKYNRKSIFLEE